MNLQRYWINQPSTLQPDHNLHGRKVLANKDTKLKFTDVYFIDGPVIRQFVNTSSLSPGWNNKK